MLLPPASTSVCGAPAVTWPAVLATRGSGSKTAPHTHHVMHLTIARHAPIRVSGADGASFDTMGLLTAPDAVHSLDARGAEVILVFIDPESEVGARMLALLRGPVTPLDDARVAALWRLFDGSELGGDPLERWVPAALDALGEGAQKPRVMHPRVRVALRHIDALRGQRDPTLRELADVAGLSTSRFAHAFTESLGVSLRTFLLWRKVQLAVIRIASGDPLAKAAADAGFADAAHMSRTFRRMFGTTPSDLRRQSQAPKAPALLEAGGM